MRIQPSLVLLATMLLTSFVVAADDSTTSTKLPPPPPTAKHVVTENIHGVTITDPYRWLEDQEAPETRKWIDEQNAYTRSILDRLPGRDQIASRMSELLKVDVVGVPIERNERLFYTERKADQDLAVIRLRDERSGKDEVLIDPNPMSPDHSVSVAIEDVIKDASLLAYGIRRGGADEVEIHFNDINTRQDFSDVLPRARYIGVALLPDRSGLYYGLNLPGKGPRIRFHKFGAPAEQDQQIFGDELGQTEIAFPSLTEDGRYLIIDVLHGASADKSELYFQDLAAKGEVKPLITGIAARFEFDLAGHIAYVRTNWTAPNSKIIAVDLDNPARDKWHDIIPESDAAIESYTLAGGKIVVNYLRNAAAEVKIFNAGGKEERKLDLPTIGSVNAISGRWENNYMFFRFDTFHIPAVIYRYNIAKSSREEWARERRPVDSTKFEVKQVWYASKDGARIPMFLLYAKDLKLNGNNAVYLTGYGGFNLSLTPAFSTQAVYWAERGGVWAVPNLRGGGEFGEKWHQAGMMEHKQNVFDDFVAAAEWLIANKYTNSQKLAIAGGSNGGLLVGAALTQRPDLYRAVLCSFPLLDMLRYQNFLVARYWTPEYGSAEDAAQFKYIYAYSPYQHVKPGAKYPAVMLWSGDADTRVAPLHARKMAAMLQADNGGPNPILLHYDVKGGHSDARPVSKVIDDVVDQLSFLFWQLGVTGGPQ